MFNKLIVAFTYLPRKTPLAVEDSPIAAAEGLLQTADHEECTLAMGNGSIDRDVLAMQHTTAHISRSFT
jgi:hypothetical protein